MYRFAGEALPSLDANAIVWLHLPHDAAAARELLWSSASLLAPARIVALSDTPSDEQALALMERGAAGLLPTRMRERQCSARSRPW